MVDNRVVRLLAALLLFGALCNLAFAAAQRTFVATTGLDTHPCSLTAVVRTSGNNTLTGDSTDVLGTLTANPRK